MILHFKTPHGQDTLVLSHTDTPPKRTPRLCQDGKIRHYHLVRIHPCMTSTPDVMEVWYEELPITKAMPFRVVQ